MEREVFYYEDDSDFALTCEECYQNIDDFGYMIAFVDFNQEIAKRYHRFN